MCGIWGVVGRRDAIDAVNVAEVGCRLQHRGPDDHGCWRDQSGAALLGHARLAIVDLSSAGHQPMASASGRFVIILNGEIYNHQELRERLPQRGWRGHSDTETLLACIEAWGTERTLDEIVGMFAIALWDRERQSLVLARDRFGEKPLYYGYVGRIFAFASELKPMKELPGFRGEIDRGALALYMRHNAIPAPWSIYRGIAKLLPGSWIELTAEQAAKQDVPVPKVYWSALAAAARGVQDPLQFSTDADAVDALDRILGEAVRGQLMSDVPLGAFLSGGVDSSAIVALMQRFSRSPVKTFSIGSDEERYDEARHAKAVAKHLGTDHTELYVSARDMLAVIPRLPSIYDEPFADSSQVPTFLVAALARRHVTVALSGDGGDELFGGYNRYALSARLARVMFRVPRPIRRMAAASLTSVSPTRWNSIASMWSPFVPRRLQLALIGDKIHKGAAVLDAPNGAALYRQLVTHWEPDSVVVGAREPDSLLATSWPALPSLVDQMMAIDAVTYLPDDILVKVDRAAMAVSLETRVPLLDHRVFEFAWRLPQSFKIRDGQTKWILRQLLYRYVPRSLIERPKMGFGIPIDLWLRGPLREWADDLLDEGKLRREGFFNPMLVRQRWQEHLSGKRNWSYQLWDLLMFQEWLAAHTSAPATL